MDVWALPGPTGFLRRVERVLRDGASVVARFPVRSPSGFREQLLSSLRGTWRCAVFRPEPAAGPFEALRTRFAPQLSEMWGATLLDLCEYEEFHGRLIWLEGLGGLNWNDWLAWKQFLSDYAQASRGVREFERTLFVAVLEGAPPADPPDDDVTLTRCDWCGVVDEMDLLLLAHEHFCGRNVGTALRSLLATTVARVASWEPEVAERLLDESDDVILDPGSMLRSVAAEREWTRDTAVGWEYGTASGNGMLHAALAALEDPPRELRRRMWSAQLSVLLPVIDLWRRDFVLENRALLGAHLDREGNRTDPLDLDVGDLTGMVQRPGFDRDVHQRVRQLNNWRRDLAHLKPLPYHVARRLAGES